MTAPFRGGWKLPSELTQDEVDEALYSLERGYCLVSGPESYLRATATCRVDFSLGWRDQPRTHHFEAELQLLASAGNDPVLVGESTLFLGEAQSSSEVELLRHEEDGFGNAMFVVVGEVAKEGKWVDVIALPRVEPSINSAVRLKPLNEAPVFWPEQRFASTFRRLPLTGTVGNRKLDPLRITWFPRSSKDLGELPSQLIQRRVKVLSDISNGVGEVFSELSDRRHAVDAKNVVSRLRVEMGADYCLIRWITEGLEDALFETGKMSVAPAKFANRGAK